MNHAYTPQSVARRGISLLEVLISAFVLSIGMLGLLSLVPVGGYRMGQVNQFDRAAATGRHAFREFKTRDMLEPNRWMWWDDTDAKYIRTWKFPEGPGVDPSDVSKQNVDDYAETFCVDPTFIARGFDAGVFSATWPGRTFPYDLQITTSPFDLGTGDYQNAPRMPRVTLSMLENFSAEPATVTAGMPVAPVASSMVSSVAERIFLSQNEGIYSLPTDESQTPIRLYSGGNTIEQFEGGYSWMAMVSRAPHEVLPAYDSTDTRYYDISPSIRNEYQVSIIVYAKRNLDVDVQSGDAFPAEALASERICGIEFLNGLGLGGGDVAISAGPAANLSSDEAREYLAVKPNQWIMVCAWAPRPTPDPPAPAITFSPVYGQNRDARPVYRWYRVVATDNSPEIVSSGGTDYWVRYLTLDGPDWNPNEFCNIDGAAITSMNPLTDTYAVLVDGVVAVFERTMRRQE